MRRIARSARHSRQRSGGDRPVRRHLRSIYGQGSRYAGRVGGVDERLFQRGKRSEQGGFGPLRTQPKGGRSLLQEAQARDADERNSEKRLLSAKLTDIRRSY